MKAKKLILKVWFQIGVNVIGLPEFHKLTKPLSRYSQIETVLGSKFHKQ